MESPWESNAFIRSFNEGKQQQTNVSAKENYNFLRRSGAEFRSSIVSTPRGIGWARRERRAYPLTNQFQPEMRRNVNNRDDKPFNQSMHDNGNKYQIHVPSEFLDNSDSKESSGIINNGNNNSNYVYSNNNGNNNGNNNSANNNSANNNGNINEEKKYQDHVADLLVSCDGSCGSELGLILHHLKHTNADKGDVNKCELCEKVQKVDFVTTFEKHFWNLNDPLRQCLIDDFEKLGCRKYDNFENCFIKRYNDFKNVNEFISGPQWSVKLTSFFYHLLYHGFDSILSKLANLSCKYPSTMTLRDEILLGIQDNTLDLNLLSQNIQRIRSTNEFKQMKDKGYELTNDEIMAVYLYTAMDELSSKFRESHRFRETCKFKKLYENFARAVLKMYKTFYDSNVPKTIYHGTSILMPLNEDKNGNYKWTFRTITSFTSNFRIALGFGTNNNDGPTVTLLKINDFDKKLKNGEIIGADIAWVSALKDEDEWAILPIQLISNKNRMGTKTYPNLGNRTLYLHEIAACKSEDIGHILDESDTKLPLLTNFIAEKDQAMFSKVLTTFAWTVGLFYSHKCDKCGIASKCPLWDGNVVSSNIECPACRRINFGAFEQIRTKVQCYTCNKEYRRDEFVQTRIDNKCINCRNSNQLCQKCKHFGYLCPGCFTPQKKSKEKYILQDPKFQEKLKNEILGTILNTVKKYGAIWSNKKDGLCISYDTYHNILRRILSKNDYSVSDLFHDTPELVWQLIDPNVESNVDLFKSIISVATKPITENVQVLMQHLGVLDGNHSNKNGNVKINRVEQGGGLSGFGDVIDSVLGLVVPNPQNEANEKNNVNSNENCAYDCDDAKIVSNCENDDIGIGVNGGINNTNKDYNCNYNYNHNYNYSNTDCNYNLPSSDNVFAAIDQQENELKMLDEQWKHILDLQNTTDM